MRTTTLFVCALLFATTAWAVEPLLIQGTQSVSVSGDIDLEGPGGTTIDLGGEYTYFIRDYLEVGGGVSYLSWELEESVLLTTAVGDTEVTLWQVSALGRYHFETGSVWVPYVGGAISWVDADIGVADESTFSATASAGVNVFLTDTAAIDLSLGFTWADKEIFVNDAVLEDTDLRLTAGVRIFF